MLFNRPDVVVEDERSESVGVYENTMRPGAGDAYFAGLNPRLRTVAPYPDTVSGNNRDTVGLRSGFV